MALSKIDTNAIADDAVDNTKLDLASNYAFTGTVTGAGENNINSFFAHTPASFQSIANATNTKVEASVELFDSNGCYDTST